MRSICSRRWPRTLSYRRGTGRSPSPVVDGHSLLSGRALALGVLITSREGTGAKHLLPSMATHIIVQTGDGAKPLPRRRWAQLTSRAGPRPGSPHYYPRGDRCEASAPVDGRSIIVQMGDGAKPLPHLYHKLDYNPETNAMISS